LTISWFANGSGSSWSWQGGADESWAIDNVKVVLNGVIDPVPVTVRVDDGRGGFDTQSYTIDVSNAAPGKVEGTVFNDLDGNGLWDKGRFLQASQDTNSILQFDGTTGAFIGYFVPPGSGGLFKPNAIIFGPDGDLYVDSYRGGNDVLRFDGRTGAFISTFVPPGSGGLQAGAGMTFGPDGNLYVANTLGNDVLRYDGTTGAFLGTFVSTTSGGPREPDSLNFRPDGYLYVGSFADNDVLRFDGKTGAFIDTFVSPGSGGLQWAQAVVFGSDNTIYIDGLISGTVYRYDASTGAFIDVVAVGDASDLLGGMLLGPDGDLYVSAQGSSKVFRVDPSTGKTITVFIAAGSGGLSTAAGSVFSPSPESGIPDRTVYLDLNQNGTLDANEPYRVTDTVGHYSFDDLPPGTYTVAEVPQLGWVQTSPPGNTYSVTVQSAQIVADINFGNQQSTTQPVNHPPVFTTAGPTSAIVGQLLRYDAKATDQDHDPLTYDLVVKPNGMGVDPTTGTVVWFPTASQIGPQDVTLRVQDGKGGVDLQSFTINVTQANTPPQITSTPKGPAVVGVRWVYQVKAQDAEGDEITFSLGAHPVGMSIDPKTGLVQWTPTADQVGKQHIEITATDIPGASTTQLFDLPVVATAPDDPPQVSSQPRGSVRLGTTYLYQVIASDPNGDPLRYSLPTSQTGMSIDANGLVTWTPTAAQLGANAIQVKVDDGRGGFATQTFSINVVSSSVNHAPNIVSNPPQVATVGKLYAYDLTGSDPDNDPLVWSLDSAPAGMSIDGSLGTLRWTPTSDELGSQQVVVRVIDGQGGFATQTYSVTVRSVNLPPAITSAPPTTADTADTYTYAVRATDPENDALTFSLSTFPTGMTIDKNSGLIQWGPDATQVGSQNVAIQVDDGQGGIATQTYTVVVANAATNQPPVITSTPSQVATVGVPYTYQVTARDPEGQALMFKLLVNPAGMNIDETTGLVTWTPTSAQLGSQSVVVGAVDPLGAGGSQSFSIVVNPVNHPPVLEPITDKSVTAGLQFRYDVHASDPDGNNLFYSLDAASETRGMIIDGLGRMGWITTKDKVGSYPVIVTVTDALGATASQSFNLTVSADGQAPVVNLVINPNPVNVGQPSTIIAQATDNVGVVSRALTINDVAVPIDSQGRATVLNLPGGTYTVVAAATDAAGNVGSDTGTLVIRVPDPIAPVVAITSPVDGDTITHAVDVIGTASDDNLASYTLSVAPEGSDSFTQIASGTTSVTDGVLGQFDPTSLANGPYTLRLQATDLGGNVTTLDETVNVAGDLKLGNFTLSFTDLSIPVSGIPVTLTRTYDSLNAGSQDQLGFGWRLEYRDTDLRTSVRPTTTDEQEAGIFNPYRDGSKVYITMPGGKREGFTFQPVRKSGFGGIFFYSPAFVPDRGVTSTLSVPDATLIQTDSGDWYGANDLAYNPADTLNWGGVFYLTTKDGLAYTIDANTGQLDSVSDANGNALSFTDTSIDSNRGVHITFDLDPQGRIVAAHDPMNNTVKYQYDAKGDLVSVTDRNQNITKFVYDAPGHPHFLTQVIDPLGRTGVRTDYDTQGRLISLVGGAGKPVQFSYDPDHSIETVTDGLGNPTTYEYDAFGNVVREVNALSKQTLRTYDDANNMTSETDPLNHTTKYTYDGDGNVLTTTDPMGNTTTNTYLTMRPSLFDRIRGARSVTLLATTTDPLGNTTKNSYDGAGNLVSNTDAADNVTQYTYDAAGNQTSIIDANKKTTTFDYDGAGHLTRQTDVMGNVTSYTYDANGNQLTQTTTVSGRTLVTTTAYDASGHPISVKDAEGNTTKTEYDKDGRQLATYDGLNNKTTFLYDDRGQLIETDFADKTKTTTTYDDAGHRLTSTDRGGRTTTYHYDALGRLIETDYIDGTNTKTEYDDAGRVTAQIDELGNRTEFSYDDAGRQIAVRDALSHTTTTVYDKAGRRISTTDPMNHTTNFVYDKLGRLIETDYADGTSTKTKYDALGRAIAQTDQLDRTTQYHYDDLGRLIEVDDALKQKTLYAYDEAGDLTTQIDANGHITHYEYDGLGRRTKTTLPMGPPSTTAYDAAGNVKSTTDFNGKTITDDYDSNNRLIAQHFPDGTTISFTYTPTGQRASVKDARGTTTYAYDQRDRLLSRTDPDGTAISYTYDAAGNRTSVTIPAGKTKYTFDKLNRTATVTDPQGGVTTYTYDADGNLVKTTNPNGTSETRQYDALNRLVYLENDGPSGVISSYRYTLASTGRRDSVVEDTGRKVAYQYDALDRLLEELITNPDGSTRKIDYTYDPVGNRLTMNGSAQGETDSTYDANDELLTETTGGVVTKYTYDKNGNTLSKFTSAVDQALYEWDSQNHIVGATVTDATGTKHIAYAYDADGIRVSSKVDADVTRYLIDTVQPYAQVLEEYTPGGVIQVSYVYGNDLISQNRGGSKSFYHVDGLGSTRALTNASGVVTDRYVYDAFGRMIRQTGSTVNVYLFAGEQRDANVGLDYLRARYLDTSTGRFYARDRSPTVNLAPLNLHSYAYALEDPVNETDPGGRQPFAVTAIPALLPILHDEPGIRVGTTTRTRTEEEGRPAFRRGGRTATNLTPRLTDVTGLSLSTTPTKGWVFPGGKTQLRTLGFEVDDDPTLDDPGHFLVRPGPVQEALGYDLASWAASRAGIDENDPSTWHRLTHLLRSAAI
jgi:RHS repeat-associated protein